MDLLSRIKRLVLQHNVDFTGKALLEMGADGLTEEDVSESILNASRIRSKRSTSTRRSRPGEKVHIIEGSTFDGILVYTKGVIRKFEEGEVFYILISAKRSLYGASR